MACAYASRRLRRGDERTEAEAVPEYERAEREG